MEEEWIPQFRRHFFDNFEERLPCLRQVGLTAIDDAQLPLKLQLGNCDPHQVPTLDLRLGGQARHKRDSVAESDTSLDRFEAGQLNSHVQRHAITSECLHDFLALRRWEVGCNEVL